MTYELSLDVNGMRYLAQVRAHDTLLHVIRENLGLTGTKEGCDDSECGACMVLLDGHPINSCSFLALQAAHGSITTVEGLATEDELHPLQRAFLRHGAVQCGFCTPGMLISAVALVDRAPHPTDAQIERALAGNLCRCTGYKKIISAVRSWTSEHD